MANGRLGSWGLSSSLLGKVVKFFHLDKRFFGPPEGEGNGKCKVSLGASGFCHRFDCRMPGDLGVTKDSKCGDVLGGEKIKDLSNAFKRSEENYWHIQDCAIGVICFDDVAIIAQYSHPGKFTYCAKVQNLDYEEDGSLPRTPKDEIVQCVIDALKAAGLDIPDTLPGDGTTTTPTGEGETPLQKLQRENKELALKLQKSELKAKKAEAKVKKIEANNG